MSKKEDGRWDEFKFKEGVDYSTEEVKEVLGKIFGYLKENQMRFDILMIVSPKKWKEKFVLSDTELNRYKNYFRNKYLAEDAVKEGMDSLSYIYHLFDVSLDKALEIVDYAMVNGYVMQKAIKDKLGTDVNEVNDFLHDVVSRNLKFGLSQAFSYLTKIVRMFTQK